jgi:dipeptidyl aminopeptidase/acylaminoacyl peptidase
MHLDIDRYLTLPRVDGLALSPDGRRLVTTVAVVGPDGKKFVTALWEIDPSGERAPRRLTRSAPGESGAVFLPDGGLLFRSSRKDPDAKPDGDDDDVSALWLLPADGGEARLVLTAPDGVAGVKIARDEGTVLWSTGIHPGADTLEAEEAKAKARKDAGVSARLYTGYPIRWWDHYLGPREPHLFATTPPDGDDGRMDPGRDLTPAPGIALEEAGFDITPDGSTVVTTWRVDERSPRTRLIAVDVAGGERRTLFDDPDGSAWAPVCSPDGRSVAVAIERHSTPETAESYSLRLIDLASGKMSEILPAGFEHWPHEVAWAPDSSALFFVADEDGRAPVFRVDLVGPRAGQVTRLSSDGCFANIHVSPDGDLVYALRNSYSQPPQAVVLDAGAADAEPRALPTPGLPLELPGVVEELEATTSDGTRIRSWLVRPPDASAENPAPLLLWIHGGPLSTWNAWSWRWNPHMLAARGYAVLLPDPALSTGYGQDFIQRGWGSWGHAPYTDLLAALDGAAARSDIDEHRMAAMGGSFGGYMANWAAGQTDRFRCIVTHASIWSLEQFGGTTDEAGYWEREIGPSDTYAERHAEHSPDRYADNIRTPMLVIHGELDHRVPIGEALRLWSDLHRRGVDAKFLYFPDENHWILKPQNIKVWYQTIFAYLDQYVLGKDWVQPELL